MILVTKRREGCLGRWLYRFLATMPKHHGGKCVMCYIAKLLNLWEKRRGEDMGETEIDRKRGRERDGGRKGEG